MDDSQWLGRPPNEVAASLAAFEKSADRLSSDPNPAVQYDGQWVAVHLGEIKASNADLDLLLAELDANGISRTETLVRFVERQRRTLIL